MIARLLALSLTLCLAVPAVAQPVPTRSFSTNAINNYVPDYWNPWAGSGHTEDPQGPASSGTVLSEVSAGSASTIADATAAADDAGYAGMQLQGEFFDPGDVSAHVTMVDEFTNGTGTSVDWEWGHDPTLLSPLVTIEIDDLSFSGLSQSDLDPIHAGFDMSVVWDSSTSTASTTIFQLTVDFLGGRNGFTINATSTANEMADISQFGDLIANSYSSFDVDLTQYTSGIQTTASPGSTMIMTTTINAFIDAPLGDDTGGYIDFGTPYDLAGGFSTWQSNGFTFLAATVPEPGAVGLVISGLVGVAGFARRRRAA